MLPDVSALRQLEKAGDDEARGGDGALLLICFEVILRFFILVTIL